MSILSIIPVPKEAIMKPNELSLNPKSTVKNVWPRMNKVPAPIKQNEIEKAIFLIFLVLKK